jgi:hypothetical protein
MELARKKKEYSRSVKFETETVISDAWAAAFFNRSGMWRRERRFWRSRRFNRQFRGLGRNLCRNDKSRLEC